MKTLTTLTAAAALMAAPAFAQVLYPTYDLDADGFLTLDEYNQALVAFAAPLSVYDRDGDNMLDADEFAGELNAELNQLLPSEGYGTYDIDGDGNLSIEEYNSALYQTYDVDQSGTLDVDEAYAMERDFDAVGIEITFIES